jgi:hypothetical protein
MLNVFQHPSHGQRWAAKAQERAMDPETSSG